MPKQLRGYFVLDEDGTWNSFEGSIGDELVNRGIIFRRDGVWQMKNSDRHVLKDRYPHLAICDFCSTRPVVWDIDCKDFIDPLGGVSKGGWAACDTCGQLVKSEDKAGLIARVSARWGSHSLARNNVELFWSRRGKMRPIPVRYFGH